MNLGVYGWISGGLGLGFPGNGLWIVVGWGLPNIWFEPVFSGRCCFLAIFFTFYFVFAVRHQKRCNLTLLPCQENLEGYSLIARMSITDSDVREMENQALRRALSSGESEEGDSACSSPGSSSTSGSSAGSDRPRQSFLEDSYSFPSHSIKTAPPPPPPVRATSVPMLKDRVDGLTHQGWTSCVSLDTLHKIANSVPWPQGVELCLPEDEGTSLACYEDCLVVYTFSVEAGFRLPLPDHYRDFLRLNNISASQIYPNGWRYLAAYTMRCYAAQASPRGDRMVGLFITKYDGAMINLSPSSLNLVTKPSNVGKWRNNWFLVRSPDPSSFNCPIYPTPFLRPKKPAKTLIESWRRAIYIEGPPLDFKKLITPENLEKAGLSLPRRPGLFSCPLCSLYRLVFFL